MKFTEVKLETAFAGLLAKKVFLTTWALSACIFLCAQRVNVHRFSQILSDFHRFIILTF